MKSFKLIPVGAALALFVAASTSASAFAVTVSPAGPISLSGSTTLTKSGNTTGCQATMAGAVSHTGEISITSAKFTGNPLCADITAAGMPWTGHVLSATGLSLDNVAVHTPLGACGPTMVSADIAGSTKPQDDTTISLSSQSLSGGCTVSGSLTTTPPLKVE